MACKSLCSGSSNTPADMVYSMSFQIHLDSCQGGILMVVQIQQDSTSQEDKLRRNLFNKRHLIKYSK